MVLFDNTTLTLMLDPNAGVPMDCEGQVISHAKLRVDGLITDLAKARTKIIIATPVLSEVLVLADRSSMSEYLKILRKTSKFRIEPFDERAAIEVALMAKSARDKGDKREASSETWAKIKYDRQIIAIAKIHNAVIYSDDRNLRNFATNQGLKVVSLSEIEIPTENAQLNLVPIDAE